MNERQLKRLRAILTPFMLRRVKADVASEMVAKHERTIFCDPSPRQQVLYRAMRQKLDLSKLLETGPEVAEGKVSASVLAMIMQLRKVRPQQTEGGVVGGEGGSQTQGEGYQWENAFMRRFSPHFKKSKADGLPGM